MFFKRLELVGFKSFATKTTVEFLPGTTIIVGPNGCGKSNILDSIKWVLGNQSAKQLRGGKMMDVIFGGSSSFKPLGMAQVTLTIDNTRRILPLEFDEVQITRRLYRTGESEYLLNKTNCRLRDIHDLFLGTGVGMSAYSILEQGKIDQIVNAKSDERRSIFEEAAGISKFKIRKVEALRKLERTAEDLKRLRDLINEVERQVSSLKRQAGKAESYKRAAAELRQAEMQLLVLRSAGLREQLEGLTTGIEELQAKLTTLQEQFNQRTEAEVQSKGESTVAEQKVNEKTQQLFDLTQKIKELEHQSARCRDRIDANARRMEQIAIETKGFDERAAELVKRRGEAEARHVEAKGAEEKEATLLKEKEAAHAALRSQVDEATRRIEQLQRDTGKLREKISHCENTLRIEETLIARNEETLRETDAIIERVQAALAEYAERKGTVEARLAELSEKLKSTEESASSLQIRFAEAHGKIGEMTRELEQTRRDLHQRQARLATLKELKANFEGFQGGVRGLMKAGIPGVIGPIVALIKSRGEYEIALEAALGARLQYVAVERAEAAWAAMAHATKADLGRVTLLPIDRLVKPAAPDLDKALKMDGVIGHAPALIDCDASNRGLIDCLLGDALLVKDFDTARRAAAEFPGLTFAALTGEVIHATGAFTGGSMKASGLLGREREIHELTQAVEKFGARQDELTGLIQTERAQADEVAKQIDTAKGSLNELKVERGSLSKELEAAQRMHNDASQQLGQRRTQQERLTKEIASKRDLMARTEQERVASAKEFEELVARLEKAREESRTCNESFLALSGEVAEARTALAKIRERLMHLGQSIAGLDREQRDLNAASEARAREVATLEQANAQSRGQIGEIDAQAVEVTARRKAIDDELTLDRTEKEKIADKLKQIAHDMEQISRDVRVAENDLHERQVRRAELQGTLNNLSEQAQEKFEKTLEEIAGEMTGTIEKEANILAQEAQVLRQKIDRMGPVNLAALDEFEEQSKRLGFLVAQEKDLTDSKTQIEESIAELDEKTKALFHETFESVRGHFVEMFRRLFNGGKADLVIEQTGGDPLLDGGVEIIAQPPGKKLQSLALMSGGEKAMTAVSLLFALFLHKPAPFAVLDEIDAPLDDANVERFKRVVHEFSKGTQFVIITHNKQTMELADAIYGVTMEESGVSKLVSVRFEQAAELAEPSA